LKTTWHCVIRLNRGVATTRYRDFLQIGRFARDLRRVERNVFGIFLSLDFNKALIGRFTASARFVRNPSRARMLRNGLNSAEVAVNNS
jgi:hypothetical protein